MAGTRPASVKAAGTTDASAGPLVRFEGVRKECAPPPAPPAVRDLDLAVERGEFLTLLGPSGSGKTTILMMLAGFERPTAGRILLDGRDIAGLPPHRRCIGVVFQSHALFPHMSVAENIAFPLEMRGVRKTERTARVRRALSLVRLEGYEERRPSQLSGGQQQRVALARALVFEPPIVLLDEPLAALDKSLREEMQLELRALQRRLRVTMLYVTHDQQEAMTLSDRIAVFEGGRIRQLATPRTLYEEPENAFVAGFVGENNLLPGTVIGPGEEEDECRVRLDVGLEVEARVADAGGPGSRCVVAVRPERVAIAAVPAREFGEEGGALAAMVMESIFLGDHVRLKVSLGDRGEIVAKRPAMGPPPPPPGTHVSVAWHAANARAFRMEEPLG
ncbi:MAG: ABC transporter ATP-binding protein [Acetobacteraceae bacterium]|nr:ABC transporter ATP-binding protein [Acetobacteraceae bacterium]